MSKNTKKAAAKSTPASRTANRKKLFEVHGAKDIAAIETAKFFKVSILLGRGQFEIGRAAHARTRARMGSGLGEGGQQRPPRHDPRHRRG